MPIQTKRKARMKRASSMVVDKKRKNLIANQDLATPAKDDFSPKSSEAPQSILKKSSRSRKDKKITEVEKETPAEIDYDR